jgi:UrcA family protein
VNRLNQSIAALTLAGLLVGFSATASAGPVDGPDVAQTVPAADLDLSKPKDVDTLYRRIRRTALSLCKTEHSAAWDVKRHLHQQRCFEQAVDRAVARANEPALAALHRGFAGRLAKR